jgi:hypothetical protein
MSGEARLEEILRNSELENASVLVEQLRAALLPDLEGVPQHRDVVGDARLFVLPARH